MIHIIFNASHIDYNKYQPVYEFIVNKRKGNFVYGGSKYKADTLTELKKYLSLISELRRASIFIALQDKLVDEKEKEIKVLESSKDFDDAHIIAIIIIGDVRIICTLDKRADKYIKNVKFYPKKFKRPKIYRGIKHKHLLT